MWVGKFDIGLFVIRCVVIEVMVLLVVLVMKGMVCEVCGFILSI